MFWWSQLRAFLEDVCFTLLYITCSLRQLQLRSSLQADYRPLHIFHIFCIYPPIYRRKVNPCGGVLSRSPNEPREYARLGILNAFFSMPRITHSSSTTLGSLGLDWESISISAFKCILKIYLSFKNIKFIFFIC